MLLGDRLLYYLLAAHDPEFGDLFKVMADFEHDIDRSHDADVAYARLIAGLVRQHGLRPFDRGAVARAIEYASRLASDGAKLSLHMRSISDLLHEAERCAIEAGRSAATAGDVQIRGFYYEGWTLANDPTRMRDRADMIARVKNQLMLDPRLDPVDVLRAVIHLLVEHVSPGEIRHILSTLPRPIASLWQDLTGHALDTLGANQS